ncbi:MAG: SGNH/GDSL hydrolase family protein [Roseateles sp.]|uniref:SGNH/GDSL hydrolase family protein n=1 Tax=Roseateles sp. TaxID=1971397 RepID=UPI0040375138
MSYRLLARMLAGFGLCAALSASAGPYSSLFVFGDSLSDSGNNALLLTPAYNGVLPPVVVANDSFYSPLPSSAGTYSNGPVWTQYLAQSLGLTLLPSVAGGTNYAFGGAQTGVNGNDAAQIPGFPFSMRTQLDIYLNGAGNVADASALYVVAGGGNNVRVALEAIAAGADASATVAATVTNYAADMAGLVASLKLAGAQHVLVMNTPNFGLTPLANAKGVGPLASALSFDMDAALEGALVGSGVKSFDMYDFLTRTVQAGAASGFSNLTNACAAEVNNCDVNTSLFWDAIHPTTLAHQQLATAVLAVAVPVPEPGAAAMLALGLAVLALGARRRARVQQG